MEGTTGHAKILVWKFTREQIIGKTMTQPIHLDQWYQHNLNPIAFSIGDTHVPWYWLVYVVGWFWCDYAGKKWIQSSSPRSETETLLKAFTHFMLLGWLLLILGARLGYVVFYNLSYYVENPDQILAVWNGGMSFHGGFVGLVIAAVISSKRYKQSIFSLTDPIALTVPIVLFFGRIANFINGELPGRVTTVPWAVVFPSPYNDTPRHPSTIYEALLEGLAISLILFTTRRALAAKPGHLSLAFVALYAAARFIAEFFRAPDPQIGFIYYLTLGQWLSIGMLLLAGYVFSKLSDNPKLI